jgi:hypothetical protein
MRVCGLHAFSLPNRHAKDSKMDAKCKCQHCNTHLEFDDRGAGQMVACPHCGLETMLYVPPVAKHVQQNTSRLYLAISGFIFLAGILLLFALRMRSGNPDRSHAITAPFSESISNSVSRPDMATNDLAARAAKRIAESQRRIDEAVQRVKDHYNSPGEVYYRTAVSNELSYEHDQIMLELAKAKEMRENGYSYSDELLEMKINAIKFESGSKIEDINRKHDLDEAEWNRQENERISNEKPIE